MADIKLDPKKVQQFTEGMKNQPSLIDKMKNLISPQAPTQKSAMDRRMQQLGPQEQLMGLHQGIQALQYIQDPQERDRLAHPLLEAFYKITGGQNG